ncbi:MAG: exopolysaccharide biosynthesis protein [Firmicutes bacterium]|nr:exopolysaccharide biosynthesis protein [Bacillota bacterium]
MQATVPLATSVSDRLRRRLEDRAKGSATVGEIVDLSNQHGFGLIFIVLALPTLVPVLPPGTAVLVGLLFVFLGLQRCLGLRHPWLPARVRGVVISPKVAKFIVNRALPVLDQIESRSRKRWKIGSSEPVSRLAAVAVALLGLVMVAPLPFMNTLPAMMVLAIGVGFLKGDGLFLLLGTIGTAVLVVALVALFTAAGTALFG